MTADRRNLWIGGAVLVTLLLAVIAPNFRGAAASLAHPDPVGPTVYSKSAIGHLAFRRLLEKMEIPVSISESGSGGYVGGSALIVAEPRSDDATLSEIGAMLTSRNVLLVLPKRVGKPDPDRPYWLADDKLVADDSVARVLHFADKGATLVRGGSWNGLTGAAEFDGAPAIEKPQLIRSKTLRPLLASADGILIGERQTRTGRLIVLSDPDLIANYNLAQGDNSVLAMRLVEHLRGEAEAPVIFDEFTHGFSEKPFHLLGILLQFPFVLVTAQMGLATLLLIWAALGRFGAPTALTPPLEAGNRSLIDTATRLLAQSGRISELSERYLEEMVRDTGRRMRAPEGLDRNGILAWIGRAPGAPKLPEGGGSPEEIWKWRKELLGGSRANS